MKSKSCTILSVMASRSEDERLTRSKTKSLSSCNHLKTPIMKHLPSRMTTPNLRQKRKPRSLFKDTSPKDRRAVERHHQLQMSTTESSDGSCSDHLMELFSSSSASGVDLPLETPLQMRKLQSLTLTDSPRTPKTLSRVSVTHQSSPLVKDKRLKIKQAIFGRGIFHTNTELNKHITPDYVNINPFTPENRGARKRKKSPAERIESLLLSDSEEFFPERPPKRVYLTDSSKSR